MSEIVPVDLKKTDNRELQISWSDNRQQCIPFRILRDACPCATCKDKAIKKAVEPGGSLPILSAAEAQPLDILSMRPVGNYAYNIQFSDGHSTGIFTFGLLRSLG